MTAVVTAVVRAAPQYAGIEALVVPTDRFWCGARDQGDVWFFVELISLVSSKAFASCSSSTSRLDDRWAIKACSL